MINNLPKSLIESATKLLVESRHPMIDVDGEMKHRHNSNGQPIHHTDEGIRNFHRWFGDSKVTDKHGRPMVMHHGTTEDFDKFQDNRRGLHFASPSPTWVSKFISPAENQHIMPVYVKASNPFDYENKEHVNRIATDTSLGTLGIKQLRRGDWSRIEDRTTIGAIKKRFDGVYVKEDDVKNLAVFHPSQIKSAIGNNGDFHPEKDTITESTDTRIPFADISHHHSKKHLDEGKIEDWVNKNQSYENQVNNFNFDTSIHSIRPKTFATEDAYKGLADDQLANLESHHKEAVDNYINGGLEHGDETGSFRVNDHLIKSHRAKKKPKTEFYFGQDKDFQRYLNLDDLDDALTTNKLEKPLTTYSGIGFNPNDILKGSDTLHLPAYTSSSTNRGVAVMYAKPDKNHEYHVIQIQHPKGSTGLYVGDREDFSDFKQKEHIMPRDSKLKINPKPDEHLDNMGRKLYVWKATRID